MFLFSTLTDCTPLMFKQFSLCFFNTFLLLKKHFFVLWNIYLLKFFDEHVMRFVIIIYKQQIHQAFKFLAWNVNCKNQFIFVTKYVNVNIIFRFNLTKIFFSRRKLNLIIIKIIIKFYIFSCNSFWTYFYWNNMPNMTPRLNL